MSALTSASLFGGHRVRVMWERREGIRGFWPLKRLRRPEPIYVFLAYTDRSERPVRICYRGYRERPFLIEDPLAYDGGNFNHGPYANAARYDAENHGHTLSDIFRSLYRWAKEDLEVWTAEEQEVLHRMLEEFHSWIWQEHRRDRSMLPGGAL